MTPPKIDTVELAKRIGCDEAWAGFYSQGRELGVTARWGVLHHGMRERQEQPYDGWEATLDRIATQLREWKEARDKRHG